MPTYVFEHRSGERIERFYPISGPAPEVVRVKNKRFRRIIADVHVMVPEIHQAGYWDDKDRRKHQILNNQELAEKMASDPRITPVDNGTPREFKRDLDQRIKAAKEAKGSAKAKR